MRNFDAGVLQGRPLGADKFVGDSDWVLDEDPHQTQIQAYEERDAILGQLREKRVAIGDQETRMVVQKLMPIIY